MPYEKAMEWMSMLNGIVYALYSVNSEDRDRVIWIKNGYDLFLIRFVGLMTIGYIFRHLLMLRDMLHFFLDAVTINGHRVTDGWPLVQANIWCHDNKPQFIRANDGGLWEFGPFKTHRFWAPISFCKDLPFYQNWDW
jgi:hypothetical protein